jgi:hypothetical protein
MYDSFVDWYWSVFRVGESFVAFGSQIAAVISWLMLLASVIAIIRCFKGQLPNFITLCITIVALSYAATDLLIASFYDFYRFFDQQFDYRAVSISYTLLDSTTAILVLLVMQRLCRSANKFVATADIMVIILLCNGAAHFLINGYYMMIGDSESEGLAMIYTATILFNDALLVVLMFFPQFGEKLRCFNPSKKAGLAY